jgi:hypothetical protein
MNEPEGKEATGSRPEATAPTLMPSSAGVMMLETANRYRHIGETELLPSREVMSCVRTAKAVPRKTIPTNMRDNGMCNPVAIRANAGGKAVKRMVTATISQT